MCLIIAYLFKVIIRPFDVKLVFAPVYFCIEIKGPETFILDLWR